MPIFSPQSSDAYEGGTGIPQRRGFKLFPIILFGIFALVYYFGNRQENPYTGRKQLIDMSPDQEAALGLQSYQQVLSESRVVSGGSSVTLVQDVGKRIAAAAAESGYEWEFNLIDSDQANAFCLPGGKVAIYSGILPLTQSADGLAVVMGHEIAHALSHHGAERMAQQRLAEFGQIAVNMASSDMDPGKRRAIMGAFGLGAQYGVMLPFSRKHESEADYIGLILMSRACFNPEEAVPFWERMSQANSARGTPPQFASTHPSDTTRIQQLKSWMPEALQERAKHCPK